MRPELEPFAKLDESFTVYRYNNGYMVDISGRDSEDDWVTVKLVCATLKEVFDIIEEINKIEVRR